MAIDILNLSKVYFVIEPFQKVLKMHQGVEMKELKCRCWTVGWFDGNSICDLWSNYHFELTNKRKNCCVHKEYPS